jgi:hypothetical protein
VKICYRCCGRPSARDRVKGCKNAHYMHTICAYVHVSSEAATQTASCDRLRQRRRYRLVIIAARARLQSKLGRTSPRRHHHVTLDR